MKECAVKRRVVTSGQGVRLYMENQDSQVVVPLNTVQGIVVLGLGRDPGCVTPVQRVLECTLRL